MIHAGAPSILWGEALLTGNYIRNVRPTKRLDGKTPYEKAHNVEPVLKRLRVWGCDAFVHVNDHSKSKY